MADPIGALPGQDEEPGLDLEYIQAHLDHWHPASVHLSNRAQVANRLGVSVATVRRRIRSGELPAVKLGARTVRVDPAALDEFLRDRPAA